MDIIRLTQIHCIISEFLFSQELPSYRCVMLLLAFCRVRFCSRLCVIIIQEILPCTEQEKGILQGEIYAQTASDLLGFHEK